MKTKKIMAAVLSAVALFGTCFAAGCGGGGGGTSSGGDYGNVVFNERTGEMYLDTMEGKTPLRSLTRRATARSGCVNGAAISLNRKRERTIICS